jgi:hypothetical protein
MSAHDPASIRSTGEQQGREVEEDGPPSCVVLRNGMMNGIGTGDLSLVVGGYARKELQLAPYSAAGPITSTRGGAQFSTNVSQMRRW